MKTQRDRGNVNKGVFVIPGILENKIYFVGLEKKKKQKTDSYKTDNTSYINVIVIDTKQLLRKFEFCQIQ